MSDSCDPMDCSLPGSSVHGILQARIPELVAISFSRVSSQPRNQNQVYCIAGRLFTSKPLGNSIFLHQPWPQNSILHLVLHPHSNVTKTKKWEKCQNCQCGLVKRASITLEESEELGSRLSSNLIRTVSNTFVP